MLVTVGQASPTTLPNLTLIVFNRKLLVMLALPLPTCFYQSELLMPGMITWKVKMLCLPSLASGFFNPCTCTGGRTDLHGFSQITCVKCGGFVVKLDLPSHWSIWHILWKFQVNVMSGHQVMTSYVRSCSDKIHRFCDLLHKGAHSCFPAYEYAFHASWLVFMDV